jgi:hypothetical protein
MACFQGRLIASLLPSSAKEGLEELIYLMGYCCVVSTTLNRFAIEVPDDPAANSPFVPTNAGFWLSVSHLAPTGRRFCG